MVNKRGVELSTNTVIILILAVLVLVFVVIGFTMGWNKIFPYLNPPNNVKDVSDKCALACSIGDKYGYCSSPKELKIEGSITLADQTTVLESPVTGSCYDFAHVPQLGIQACTNAQVTCGGYLNEEIADSTCSTGSAVKNTEGFYVCEVGTEPDSTN